MKTHIFFDLDDTLTPSRTPMRPEDIPLFERLCHEKDVIVVSGAQQSQMLKQLPAEGFTCMYYMLTQNGNHAIDRTGSVLWSESFTDEQTQRIVHFIERLKKQSTQAVKNENDLVELRGSQISYSLIGHNEEREKKKEFDPDASIRKALLAQHSDEVRALAAAGVEVVAGGTTCLDFYLRGKNKGFHVARLIEHEGWSKADSIYVGDALQPGRNDESVLGVIDTHEVTGPDDTFFFIKDMLS